MEVCLANHEVYHSKEEVMEQIKENEKLIEQKKQYLFGLVCSSDPMKCIFINEEECDEPLTELQDRFNAAFDDEFCGIETLVAHNVDLRYIHDNFEKTEIG